ncbi:hypothetical protein BLL52_3719 [Rhodoferax antarcticus ANT.BR]|uniref:Uncharacterized protein n=1 Tax=Rhodoferax antarcticus ANT.BR TaxID=1111071 RepID=A0A1Q8YAA0_9BURK|nr:hypothetical protein BLL52_3719 [Rhodoferax antarcticus ANT.BR]
MRILQHVLLELAKSQCRNKRLFKPFSASDTFRSLAGANRFNLHNQFSADACTTTHKIGVGRVAQRTPCPVCQFTPSMKERTDCRCFFEKQH